MVNREAVDAKTGVLSRGGGAQKRHQILAIARRQRLLTVSDPILVLAAHRNLMLVRLIEARVRGAEGVAPIEADTRALPLPRKRQGAQPSGLVAAGDPVYGFRSPGRRRGEDRRGAGDGAAGGRMIPGVRAAAAG